MKTAIIVHGTPSRDSFLDKSQPSESNRHWIPWLQNQLLIAGYQTWTPEMPRPYAPDYLLWKQEFERYDVGSESLLIGHSCGGGFLLRWLSENPVQVKKVVLVAPWVDPAGRKCPGFFNFKIDSKITLRTEAHILASDDDEPDINTSVEIIRNALPEIPIKLFNGYGHFCLSDMKTTEFPELAEIVLK